MTDHPNYRENTPPREKARVNYTWAERRSELYDRIQKVGTWQNLPKGSRALGDEYDVSHTTILNDIDAIQDWERAHLSENAVANVSILERSAIKDKTDAARLHRQMAGNTDNPEERIKHLEKSAALKAEALQLARSKLHDLMGTGDVAKAAEKLDVDANVESETTVSIDDDDREDVLSYLRAKQDEQSEG